MDSCGDHYGSKCNFSCSVGFRLNGSSTVTCNAPGNSPPGVWDSPIPVCQGTFSRYSIDVPGGGGVLPRILDRGVQRRFVNPNPI